VSAVDLAVVKDVLCLHTDRGVVWRSDPRGAIDTYLDPADFAAALPPADSYCLLGNRDNAELIVALGKKLAEPGHAASVLIVSPRDFAHRTPAYALQQLQQPGYGGMLTGSRHVMIASDQRVYALIAAGADACQQGLLRWHPAWAALSFVSTMNAESCCQLMSLIVDPRWYRHQDHPERLSRLFSHLGLTPGNAVSFLEGEESLANHYDNAVVTIMSWFNVRGEMTGPEAFLWRLFKKFGEGPEALLKCTKRLVELIVRVWMCAISGHPEVKFRPELFFDNADEVVAFAQLQYRLDMIERRQ
jgi:hypothetical protein